MQYSSYLFSYSKSVVIVFGIWFFSIFLGLRIWSYFPTKIAGMLCATVFWFAPIFFMFMFRTRILRALSKRVWFVIENGKIIIRKHDGKPLHLFSFSEIKGFRFYLAKSTVTHLVLCINNNKTIDLGFLEFKTFEKELSSEAGIITNFLNYVKEYNRNKANKITLVDSIFMQLYAKYTILVIAIGLTISIGVQIRYNKPYLLPLDIVLFSLVFGIYVSKNESIRYQEKIADILKDNF